MNGVDTVTISTPSIVPDDATEAVLPKLQKVKIPDEVR
jgi:hypothetical protein